MKNIDKAVVILTRYGYNTILDSHNYSEMKASVIHALNLADEGKYDEARGWAQRFDETVRNDVLSEIAAIQKKGDKK